MAQNDKTFCLLCFMSQESYIIVIYGTLVGNDDFSRRFFHFFKILILWVVRGEEGQKMAQNEKNFCLSGSISQEPYIFFFYLGFFNKYSRFTGQQGKEKAISLWLTLAIWLVSRYIFSTAKRLFTGCLRIVLVFAVLTIASLTSESLLGNSHVTMAIIQKSLSTFS